MGPRSHIVYLTEEEIVSLANLSRACLEMAPDSPYFKELEEGAKTSLEKLKVKLTEIRN